MKWKKKKHYVWNLEERGINGIKNINKEMIKKSHITKNNL